MLTNEEKREAIERALAEYVLYWDDLDALAEEAIVIPVEIEHFTAQRINPEGEKLRGAGEPPLPFHIQVPRTFIKAYADGHIGKPGKAIAIIISEEGSNEIPLP